MQFLRHSILSAVLVVGGCSGAISGTDGPSTPSRNDSSAAGGQGSPSGGGGGHITQSLLAAPARIRRLTGVEIRNSVRDIFLGAGNLEATFDTDKPSRHEYDTSIDGLGFGTDFAESIQTAAEKAAGAVVGRLAMLLPCAAKVTTTTKTACAREFIYKYAPQVFRRPLLASETDALLGLFNGAHQRVDFSGAVGILVEGLLQSPHFLFRKELGGALDRRGQSHLAPYEMASLLSYSVWRSTPDAALLDAAAANKLSTSAQLQAQVRRMLEDPRAHATVRDFFSQWAETNVVATGITKADPAYTPKLAKAMVDEANGFVDQVTWTDETGLNGLLTSNKSFVNAELATLYGMAAPKTDVTSAVSLDSKRRSGFLTQPGFISAHTSPSAFSPIFLGLFVRRRLFCQSLPQPPANVPAVPTTPGLSTRERFAQHQQSPTCGGCHRAFDHIGFGFENFDAVGRYRDKETLPTREVPLTGEGELEDTDADGKFTGAVELAKKLSTSTQVAECFAGHVMRFALGRNTADLEVRTPFDQASLAAVQKAAGDKRGDVRELWVQMAASDSFVLRDTSALTEEN